MIWKELLSYTCSTNKPMLMQRDTLTQIGLLTQMIDDQPPETYLWCRVVQSVGQARNNQQWLFQRRNQNTLHYVLQPKKQYGWDNWWEIYRWIVPQRRPYMKIIKAGAIAISRNPVLHRRTKDIDIKYYFVRKKTQNGTIELKYCPTNEMVADILTKPLSKGQFEYLRCKLGLIQGHVEWVGVL
jgi:hypothetical protein